ncbi:oxidoreductase [Actinoplanes lobatus]|uniref:NAD(P)-dependent dehydrogenase (Short-subunit alcohol dehydrogenase family) n=1 Tax=Actinoplanes lobatus TaxID=113568 RepID=A0A7W7HNL5_9ACTN|nr:SDR family oxidoreductase [Actinoplanes lobatus]MBB4753852.1 NAD(P)-dependent dehydrogenase (short-subunit alcohol dehydrogenase family) [Actinoplanes lobatus]GGN72244.1 oxidoreductase [Actinoplanes lobatus]GIE41994.1 oxidoreductase [Actinoplanes lobatus]
MTALAGRTALVTGGSRGIGRGVCERLAADGALVAVHYGSDDVAAGQVVAAIEAAGGQAFAIRAELGVDGDADTVIRRLEEGLRAYGGTGRLDILVNNAALADSGGGIGNETPEGFDRIFAVNVRAPYFLIQKALPLMGDGGRIINIGSGVTRIALPGELAYAMTKGAMEILTRNLANEVGSRGITINTVAPGPTRTDRTAHFMDLPEVGAMVAAGQAIERLGTPQDIADVVHFLAGDAGRWITANVIDATGGSYLGPKRLG